MMETLVNAWWIADVLTFIICSAWAADDRVDEDDLRGLYQQIRNCVLFAVLPLPLLLIGVR